MSATAGTVRDSGERVDPAIEILERHLGACPEDIEPLALREGLREADENLVARFRSGEPVDRLVSARAALIDHLLGHLWQCYSRSPEASLVAVGGYGRGELHPCSDIDVMILLPDERPESDWLGHLLTALWDVGLEIGHSVRTVDDCEREARADVTIMTTLMESRLLAGPPENLEAMRERLAPEHMWSSPEFFEAKRNEQITRHHRYHDTAYNLEPNVKGSPGGLRDIQMIGWIAKRHFGADSLAELVDHRFLTPGQLDRLIEGRSFLWKVRFALHVLTGRREDRLLFDYQVKLAEMLGYEDASYTLAVEQMMQRYYRTVMDLSRLNEILLQLFQEAILLDPDAAPEPLNERFQVRNGFLQTAHDDVFEHDPSALLELFALLQKHSDIKGVSAWTVGLIKRSLHLIDEEFRQSPRNHRLFLEILRAPRGVTHALRRMNLYGVLGLYIPAFGRIVGRMQYDLFHAYTVDAHTLFVVSNLRRFRLHEFDHEYPHPSAIMQSLEKPEIAYLGGLFHDIAKGRGGDHSELGAVDAEAFCLEHGLSRYEARMVAWLVRHHLALSTTAQKKDISDPSVINEFAALVGDQLHLDYLYVLTVADVRGTNPKLWNSWKANLFEDLYELTKRALRRGLENPIDKDELIAETQREARTALARSGVGDEAIETIWDFQTPEYFLRHAADEIAWQTEFLADNRDALDRPLVAARSMPETDGIAIFLYTPQRYHTFSNATAVIDELGLSILDARITPTRNGFSMDTYIVMEVGNDEKEPNGERLDEIRNRLAVVISQGDDWDARVTRRAPRQVRMFRTPTQISFAEEEAGRRTIMELVAGDRPGLLLAVGKVFRELGVEIKAAKIVTIGERAEDVFYLTDHDQRPLQPALREALAKTLSARLGESA
ncbi:MAG: [protein-PII] uridylyltransferase [Gammaproteobacteria bacterium]